VNRSKKNHIKKFGDLRVAGILAAAATMASLSLTACSMQTSPCCASYPIKPFKAVYECRLNDTAPFKQTWQSNGVGKMRLTVSGDQRKQAVTVIDYNDNCAFSLLPDKKLALQQPLETPWISNATADQTDAVSLGSRSIEGHPCVGWTVDVDGQKSQYWMGEDTGCYVEINAELPEKSKASIKLVEYSAGAQDTADFDVPSDFRVEKSATKLSFTHPQVIN
jgi:hypothetical protein